MVRYFLTYYSRLTEFSKICLVYYVGECLSIFFKGNLLLRSRPKPPILRYLYNFPEKYYQIFSKSFSISVIFQKILLLRIN